MWIVYLADSLYEMSKLVFSENNIQKHTLKLTSAAVVTGDLRIRVNEYTLTFRRHFTKTTSFADRNLFPWYLTLWIGPFAKERVSDYFYYYYYHFYTDSCIKLQIV